MHLLLALLLGAACGYYFPNAVLRRIVTRRQRDIFETLPDALDLLTVCVEAGLSLERAMVKVAAEIRIKSVPLAHELQLVLMEMRAGFTKEKALRNFALRVGIDDIDTLVAMLIQSERFGTSMGDSLRVHSDNLRNKRRVMGAAHFGHAIDLDHHMHAAKRHRGHGPGPHRAACAELRCHPGVCQGCVGF